MEYALSDPLKLEFEFNPSSMTRTRTVTVKTGGSPGTRGGYDFVSPSEAGRASQGVTVNAESFSIKVLLDATDRMNAGQGVASSQGIQPEIDIIRSMLEPKQQASQGAQLLSSLGALGVHAFSRQEFAPVLIFKWGVQALPVFMTQAQVDIKEYMPTLMPYRAEVNLTLQIIESNNPFYLAERLRQFASAAAGMGAST